MSGRNKVILAGIGLSLIGVLVFVAPFEGISRGEAIALGVVLLVLIAMVGNGENSTIS